MPWSRGISSILPAIPGTLVRGQRVQVESFNNLSGAQDNICLNKIESDEYTSQGTARKIECPMLVGHSRDDRIMDPQGALRLYRAAVNSRREMADGTGHNQAANCGGPQTLRPPILPDWAAKQLV